MAATLSRAESRSWREKSRFHARACCELALQWRQAQLQGAHHAHVVDAGDVALERVERNSAS